MHSAEYKNLFEQYGMKNYFNEWLGTDTKEACKKNKKWAATNENEYIIYRFNSVGYRSEEFSLNDTGQTLFFGCSTTMGAAVPYEKTWAYLTYKHLRTHSDNVKYINLGVSGSSIDSIIRRAAYIIVKMKPVRVVVLFPSIYRREYLHTADMDQHWSGCFRNFIIGHSTNSSVEQVLQHSAVEQLIPQYMAYYGIRVLESLCSLCGASLYWDSWCNDFSEFMKQGLFQPEYGSYIGMDTQLFNNFPCGRDGSHPGSEAHKYFANLVINSIRTNEFAYLHK